MKFYIVFSKYILVFLSLFLICLFPYKAEATTGTITAVRILGNQTHNGWTAEIDIEGLNTGGVYDFGLGPNNDPENAKVIFTVTSPGYDATGNITTITRTIHGTKQVRKAHPDNAVIDESTSGGILTVKVALSDYIYAGDTSITATIGSGFYTSTGTPNNSVTNFSVTNNSTLAYPKVIGRWAWPGYERVTGDFLVEVVAFNQFARNGKPLAAVTFTASDQSGNSVVRTVTEMTKSTRSGDANQVLVYAATIPVAGLNQGEIITVNFEAYPWVGNTNAVLRSATTGDGVAQPDERLGPLIQLNDKNGTYGIGYAIVSNSGNDTTGQVYASQAAAEAGNAYLTIERAAQAIRTYHNANFARNNAGGGVVLLTEGTYQFPGATAATLGASMDTWLIIKPASTALKANTIINGGNNIGMQATRLKIEGLTLATSTGINTLKGRTASDVLWLHNNTLNMSQTVPVYSFKTAYATQNQITALTTGFFSYSTNKTPYALIRGNDSTPRITGTLYTVIGNKNILPSFAESGQAAGHQISNNVIYAFNSQYGVTANGAVMSVSTEVNNGIAIVQNIWESVSTVQPLLVIAGDNSIATTTNVIVWNNSFAGQRQNMAYNEYGNTNVLRSNWSQKFNIFQQWNVKTDTFGDGPPNGVRQSNWAVVYNVGSVGNISRQILFRGEFDGLGAMYGINPGYTSDRSTAGAGGGNGDYTLVATSSAIDLATTTSLMSQVLPFDFLGNPIYGARDSGAYEYQPPFTMGVHQVSTSTSIRIYGDEKFRNKTTPSNNATADLNISIPGNDTSQWLDIAVVTWQNTGTRRKVWTESTTYSGVSNTVHTIGDLSPNASYLVQVDGVTGGYITGAQCTASVCLADGLGKISFTYTGGYSTHTFSVEQQVDTNPPVISAIATSTTQTTATITWATNELATSTVFYGLTPGYGNASTSSISTTTHATTLTGLTPNTLYYYQLSVSDPTGNTATSSNLSFTTNPNQTIGEPATSAVGSGPIVGLFGKVYTASMSRVSSAQTGCVSVFNNCVVNDSSSKATTSVFTRNLTIRDTGDDVKKLQQFLINQGFLGIGNNTGYFGPLTQQAVVQYQKSVGIVPALGFFGPLTRYAVGITDDAFSAQLDGVISASVFTKDLTVGSIDPQVKLLQQYLNSKGFIVSTWGAGAAGAETTYFGAATRTALMNFQKASGINPASGYFGKKTRVFIEMSK